MRTLSQEELDIVSGGGLLEMVVAVGGILGFGYQVGKDLAARDNQLQCKAE